MAELDYTVTGFNSSVTEYVSTVKGFDSSVAEHVSTLVECDSMGCLFFSSRKRNDFIFYLF